MVVCLVFSEILLIYFAVALLDQHQDAKLDLTIQRFCLTLLLSVFSTNTSQCSWCPVFTWGWVFYGEQGRYLTQTRTSSPCLCVLQSKWPMHLTKLCCIFANTVASFPEPGGTKGQKEMVLCSCISPGQMQT